MRPTLALALGGLVGAPLVAAYWSKGYVAIFDGKTASVDRPWALDYAEMNWEHSFIFTPTVIAMLLPLAVVGIAVVRRGTGGWCCSCR